MAEAEAVAAQVADPSSADARQWNDQPAVCLPPGPVEPASGAMTASDIDLSAGTGRIVATGGTEPLSPNAGASTETAVPRGTTAAELQALIDDAPSGTVLRFQPGHYSFNRTITIDRDDISVVGAGSGATVIDVPASLGQEAFRVAASVVDTVFGGPGRFGTADPDPVPGPGPITPTGTDGKDVFDVTAPGTMVRGLGNWDVVRATVSFTMADDVERLDLVGTTAIDGTGGATASHIHGNDARNVIDGKAGTTGSGARRATTRCGGTRTRISFSAMPATTASMAVPAMTG